MRYDLLRITAIGSPEIGAVPSVALLRKRLQYHVRKRYCWGSDAHPTQELYPDMEGGVYTNQKGLYLYHAPKRKGGGEIENGMPKPGEPTCGIVGVIDRKQL